MQNPYAGIDWTSVQRLGSATHMHMASQDALANGYRHGIRHFPMSNYYPSAPYDAETRLSDFQLHQHWPARRNDGTVLAPPINWNQVITWQAELDAPYRARLPFRHSGPVFSEVPEDILMSPNAEHHGFSNSGIHVCSPGSLFVSGNIDPKGHYHLDRHGFCVGFGGTWQEGFERMLTARRHPDGGGITVNHPTWFSRLSDDHVLELLDFDADVLGIEIYNDYSARRDWSLTAGYEAPPESEPGFSLKLWDRILATGRTCWGFCVPDHSVEPAWGRGAPHIGDRTGNWHGRSVLLVPAFTEHACLKAYRAGQFYGCLKDNGLTVTGFTATASDVSVHLSAPARIRFITEAGCVAVAHGTQATYATRDEPGRPPPTFVRVEADDETGERLFLQPVLADCRT